MTNIVSLDARRAAEQESPHLAGEAECTVCGHRWSAVAPVGTIHLDCPSCDRLQGVFRHGVEPQEAWTCNCGERLFWLTRAGAMCRKCGIISSDWAE